ncbi:MAG: SurA N-terminal domain-containing protein, partial [Spongiibacter sp.]|nr:SurA N-terminal domain-containing protein [Spongiibacter sp.]
MRRRILIATAIVAVSVVVLVGVGIYQSQVVQPSEPVAVVNGQEILTRDFRARVRLIQYNLLQQYQSLAEVLEVVGEDPEAAATYQTQLDTVSQQLANPLYVGTTMLEVLIEEQL